MARPSRYSPEVRERSVRMVLEHQAEHGSQWSTIRSVAEKLGCTPETLRVGCGSTSETPAFDLA